ncbi:uncharacterized protein LOC110726650 [Chenopodium quinoa]|uniref:uncharacterized protein LOC110726650 n=1 Tax=Chenopodium quinoa TaxID=63459 RepID=UPI000B7852F2|nr:uncharacterized protein LOC110726650 [Chenopodium quinoa]
MNNINFTNPSSISQFPLRPQQVLNFSYSQNVLPSEGHSPFQNRQFAENETSFPMSQHFNMSEGEGANSNFNWSYRSTADSDDDNDDEAEENEGGDVGGGGRGNTDRRNFWSHAEDEVLVRAWLEVSKDKKKTNTNQKGNKFWAKVEAMFNNVRLFRERQFEQGTEEIKKDDLLSVRALEPLRCRWKRLSANCSKFSGAYAHAASRRGSGHSDNDVIKIARRIYRDDKTRKNTSKVFQDMHAWDILKNEQIWAKMKIQSRQVSRRQQPSPVFQRDLELMKLVITRLQQTQIHRPVVMLGVQASPLLMIVPKIKVRTKL